MRIFICLATLALTSCANLPLPSENQPADIKTGLTAQELATGECGVFLWTLSNPPSFTFFQKIGSEHAKLFMDTQELTLQPLPSSEPMNDYGNIDGKYTTATEQQVAVKGQYGAEMDGGRKIPTGSIQITKPDGWQEIIPVSGVYACAS